MRRIAKNGNYGFGTWHIFLITPEGLGIHDINKDRGLYGYPHWIQNSGWLVVWGFNADTKTSPHLMLVNMKTGKTRDLTGNPDTHEEMPYWR
jgi:hypothetical protein